MRIKPLVDPIFPGSQGARNKTIISGKKTILEIEKKSPLKSVLKKLMFSSVWGSNTVYLNWKTKRIKSGKIILQLAPSKPEKENFLLTPAVIQINPTEERFEKRTAYRESVGRHWAPGCLEEQLMMLPTPNSQSGGLSKNPDNPRGNQGGNPLVITISSLPKISSTLLGTPSESDSRDRTRTKEYAKGRVPTPPELIRQINATLPTPQARDWKGPQGRTNQGNLDLPAQISLLPTPSAQMGGEKIVETLQTKEGEPAQIGERAYDPKTKKHVQVNLNRAVQLLPTPRAGNPGSRPNKKGGKILAEEINNILLPTPRVSEIEGAPVKNVEVSNGGFSRKNKKGVRYGVKVKDVLAMLPTPQSIDYKTAAGASESFFDKRVAEGRTNDHITDTLACLSKETTGKQTGLKLQPEFVEWMMGLPIGWTNLSENK